MIIMIKCIGFYEELFEFEESSFYKAIMIQKHYIKPGSKFLIVLIENLFKC